MSLIVRNKRGQFTKVLFPRTDKVFQLFADKVVKQGRKNLKSKGKDNTGTLSKSLRATAFQEGKTGFELVFLSTDYGDFVDEGVRGVGGFKGSGKARGVGSPYRFGSGKFGGSWERFKNKISTWIKQRGIQGRDKKGQFISNKSLTFLIQRSIFQRGLERTLFYTKAFDKFYTRDFISKTETAYAEDVENLLADEMNDILNN